MDTRKPKHILFLILISFFLCVAETIWAVELKSFGQIIIKEEFDNNITFEANKQKEDIVSIINPSLKLDYNTELLTLSSKIDLSAFRYAEEKALNTERKYFETIGIYNLWERLQIKGNCNVLKDTTLESELEETGMADFRADRKRFNMGTGLIYKSSTVSDVSFDLAYRSTNYDNISYVDYDRISFSLYYNIQTKNQLNLFTVQPYFLNIDSGLNKVKNNGLSLGWRHNFNKTSQLTTFIGVRYTKTRMEMEPQSNFDHNEWGIVTDINFLKTGELFSFKLGYNNDLGYNYYGETIQRERYSCILRTAIGHLLSASVSGDIYRTETEGQLSRTNRRYYHLKSVLRYKLTAKYILELGYSYGKQNNKKLEDPVFDRSRVWFVLNLNFPIIDR